MKQPAFLNSRGELLRVTPVFESQDNVTRMEKVGFFNVKISKNITLEVLLL